MARSIQLPGGLFWRVFAGVGTAMVGVGTWFLLGSQVPNLDPATLAQAGAEAPFTAVRNLERGWVAENFTAASLLAPVAGPPCAAAATNTALGSEIDAALRAGDEHELAELRRTNPNSWLPALALGNYYLRQDQPINAERALTPLYSQKSVRARWSKVWTSPAELLGQLHFLHALGYAQLRNNSQAPEYFWDLVKNPIGKVKVANDNGLSDLPRGTPTWRNHRVPAPGCPPAENDLTSFDLYNNLLVAYQRTPFRGTQRERQLEFARRYDDPPERNPLQQALKQAVAKELESREAWVWALSNSERLLRERYQENTGPPEDSRLSLALAQVAAEADPLLAGEVAAALWHQIGELLDSAEAYSAELEEDELAELQTGITRLRLLATIGGHDVLPAGCPSGLGEEPCQTLERVRLAVENRTDPEKWADLLADGPSDDWLDALRQDTATALANVGLAAADPEERAKLAWLARAALPLGGATPAPLAELVKSLGLGQQLRHTLLSRVGRILLTGLVTALAGLMLAWVSIQMLFRKALFTSFYRLEARRKVRGR